MESNFYEKKYVPTGAIGLMNIGNICWWNSVVQALLSCPQLNKFLIENAQKFKDPIAEIYIKMITAALKNNKEEFNSSSKAFLLAIIGSRNISTAFKLKWGNQNDAIEGILAIFELINNKEMERLFLHRHTTSSICLLCKKISYENKTEDPNIPYLIHLKKSDEFEKALLCNWSITDGITCEKCEKRSNKAIIVRKLVMTREIIIIAIKNTNESYERFKYPYVEYLSLPSFNDKKLKYRHVATINHHGGRIWMGNSSSSSGHYTATCYRGDEKYWNINDSSVSECSSFAQTHDAYVLFYSLIE